MIDVGERANMCNPVSAITTFIELALANPVAIVSTGIWYLPVVMAFAGFILWNGGIVLGQHFCIPSLAELPNR